MDPKLSANKELWNELVDVHAQSDFYNLDSFLNGACSLKAVEKSILGNIEDKSLLHLQCHFGMDTLSLARKGAVVTGVDFSDKAIELAKKLSRKTSITAEFVCSSIKDLDNTLEKEFDIVFTTYGVLCWLDDLDSWAKTIYNHLKPGGTFLIVEEHPLGHILEQEGEELVMKYSYFDDKGLTLDIDGSYASETAKINASKSYEWIHTLSKITNSLISSGLTIKELNEYPYCMYKKFKCMEETDDGWWIYPKRKDLPLLFSIVATK